MKKTITYMISLVSSVLFISAGPVFSQTNINVNVSGAQFLPANITINAGDTVTWTNTSGTHNVQGGQSVFPSNPESFSNSIGSGWVFTHVFNMTGSYNYRCDVHFGSGMTGTITVNPSTGINESHLKNAGIIKSIYPIPAYEFLTIEFNSFTAGNSRIFNVVVFNIKGQLIYTGEHLSDNKIELNVNQWSVGTYIIQIRENESVLQETECLITR